VSGAGWQPAADCQSARRWVMQNPLAKRKEIGVWEKRLSGESVGR
jgi:hypothetical protein